jgi:hypothetical protein
LSHRSGGSMTCWSQSMMRYSTLASLSPVSGARGGGARRAVSSQLTHRQILESGFQWGLLPHPGGPVRLPRWGGAVAQSAAPPRGGDDPRRRFPDADRADPHTRRRDQPDPPDDGGDRRQTHHPGRALPAHTRSRQQDS